MIVCVCVDGFVGVWVWVSLIRGCVCVCRLRVWVCLVSCVYAIMQVNMKRQMLRAKLAEADSPLPPPSRILP